MNLLVVGASYRTAPVATLERLAVPPADLARTAATGWSPSRTSARPSCCPPATGSRSTRRSSGFHGGLGDICAVLAEQAGVGRRPSWPTTSTCTTTPPPCGTRSGSPPASTRWWSARRRSSASSATPTTRPPSADTAGRLLHELMQQALRVGKRVHAETGIDRAGQSVVTAALDVGRRPPRRRPGRPPGAGGRRRRDGRAVRGHADPAGRRAAAVTNRGADRAERLAEAYGATAVAVRRPGRRARPRSTSWSAATASTEPVLTADVVAAALAGRTGRPAGRCSTWPCRATSSPASPSCPASRSIDIDAARRRACATPPAADRRRPPSSRSSPPRWRRFLTWLRGADVAPTVAALRARADEVVDRRAAPAGPAPPRPHRRAAGRGRPRRAPGGAAAAALADRAGAPARRRAGRRPVRGAAARAVRPRRCRTGRRQADDVPRDRRRR